jgi:hypothetical protein
MNIDVVVLIERGLRFHVIADYDNSPVQIRNSSTTTPWEAPILKVSDEETVKDTMGPLIPTTSPPLSWVTPPPAPVPVLVSRTNGGEGISISGLATQIFRLPITLRIR